LGQLIPKIGGSSFDIRNSKYDYDGNFKLEVLKWMKTNRASLSETALHFDISTPSTVWFWQRKYEEKGVDALFKRRGRAKQMTNSPDQIQKKEEEPSELEKLQRENRLLKIENEYLKKLSALMQEPNNTDKSKRK
jgi:transposase